MTQWMNVYWNNSFENLMLLLLLALVALTASCPVDKIEVNFEIFKKSSMIFRVDPYY